MRVYFGITLIFSLILSVASCDRLKPADPVKINPEIYTELYGNAYARVLDVRFKPGQRDKMHSHPDNLIYVLKGGTVEIRTPKGEPEQITFKDGQAFYQDKINRHSFTNIGKTNIHAIVFELIRPPQPSEKGIDAVKASPKNYKVLVENQYARMLDVRLLPGQRDSRHSHPANFTYIVNDVKVKMFVPGRRPKMVTGEGGSAYYETPVQIRSMQNITKKPLHMIILELKTPQNI